MIVTPPPQSAPVETRVRLSVSHTLVTDHTDCNTFTTIYILCLWWVLVLRTVDLAACGDTGGTFDGLLLSRSGVIYSRSGVIYSLYLLLIIFLPLSVSASGDTHALWWVSRGE